MRPPPTSTLFPYTTLFRSVHVEDQATPQFGEPLERARLREEGALRALCGRPAVLDRKSTRLNSSHEWISYAVFCLKKKKNRYGQRATATGRPRGASDPRRA